MVVDINISPVLSVTNDGNAAKRHHFNALIAHIIVRIENVISIDIYSESIEHRCPEVVVDTKKITVIDEFM